MLVLPSFEMQGTTAAPLTAAWVMQEPPPPMPGLLWMPVPIPVWCGTPGHPPRLMLVPTLVQ